MTHRVKIDSDVLAVLRHTIENAQRALSAAERSAQGGKTTILSGDITCHVTEDGSYVILEDVANGSNVIEIPYDWFEEHIVKYFLSQTKAPEPSWETLDVLKVCDGSEYLCRGGTCGKSSGTVEGWYYMGEDSEWRHNTWVVVSPPDEVLCINGVPVRRPKG